MVLIYTMLLLEYIHFYFNLHIVKINLLIFTKELCNTQNTLT